MAHAPQTGRQRLRNATDQVPTGHLAVFAQPYEFSQMMLAALAVPEVISFTVCSAQYAASPQRRPLAGIPPAAR